MTEPDMVTISSPELPPYEAPQRGSRTGMILALVAATALAIPFGMRVRTALRAQHAMQAQKPTPTPARAVELVRGTRVTWKPTVTLNGTLMPARSVSLAFKATGTMASLGAKTGDRVDAGALLASLDAGEAWAQSKVAASQIETARANLALASDSERRASALAKLGAATESSVTAAKAQLSVARSSLDGANAGLALSRAILANHTLRAPFAGVITAAPTSAGGLAVAGAPLFTLDDLSTLRVVGTIGENEASLVRVGAPVTVALEGRSVPARISVVIPKVDPATRRMPIEATLANDGTLLAGVFVHATIDGGGARDVLRYPASVIRPGSQDELVVMESGAPRVRRISFVRADDGAVLVRAGVTESDDVVLTPAPEQGGTP